MGPRQVSGRLRLNSGLAREENCVREEWLQSQVWARTPAEHSPPGAHSRIAKGASKKRQARPVPGLRERMSPPPAIAVERTSRQLSIGLDGDHLSAGTNRSLTCTSSMSVSMLQAALESIATTCSTPRRTANSLSRFNRGRFARRD